MISIFNFYFQFPFFEFLFLISIFNFLILAIWMRTSTWHFHRPGNLHPGQKSAAGPELSQLPQVSKPGTLLSLRARSNPGQFPVKCFWKKTEILQKKLRHLMADVQADGQTKRPGRKPGKVSSLGGKYPILHQLALSS